jgi:hypothetical protein
LNNINTHGQNYQRDPLRESETAIQHEHYANGCDEELELIRDLENTHVHVANCQVEKIVLYGEEKSGNAQFAQINSVLNDVCVKL